MKRYLTYLALIAATSLLTPGSADAQVHFGLPSAVKSTVKKLKVKVEEKQKTTFHSYSAKTSSLGIASFFLPSGEIKEIRITDEASQEPLQDITAILTINDTGSDGLYFIIDEQGKYLPGIRNISGGSTSPQNFQPNAIPTIVEWAARTWNDIWGKKPALIDEIDVPSKDLIAPLINNGSLEYERSSTLGALALEMGGAEYVDWAFKIVLAPITYGAYTTADLLLLKPTEWKMEANAGFWVAYWLAQGYKLSDGIDIYSFKILNITDAIQELGGSLGVPSAKLFRVIVMRNKNTGTYSSYDISGTVRNASNSQVMEGAKISAYGPSTLQIASDINGSFAFSISLPTDAENKEDGVLSVNISKEGFYTSRRSIPLKYLTLGQPYALNVALTPYLALALPPNPPSNLQSSASSPGRIDLTWNDNAIDENGFEIEKSSNGIDYHSLDAVSPNTTYYADEGLAGNRTYYYRARAYNIYSTSTYSNGTSTITLNNPPAITSLTANPISISTGTATTITCAASDPDGDTLAYNWSAASGTISGSGAQVIWTAPASSGTYSIACTVSDGKGAAIQKSTNVVVFVTHWASVSNGGDHTLAIKSDGTLWASGSNSYGQLGLGDTIDRNTLIRVGIASNWVSVSAGWGHTIAIKSDGTLWASGANNSGQLGFGDTTDKNTLTRVGTASNWVSVSAGWGHTIAIKGDGTLWAWGDNSYGQLGLGDTTNRNTPIQAGFATNWASASGGGYHTLAVRTDGTLWASGSNSYGQLGLGDTTARNMLTRVGAASNWVSVSAGWGHIIAIRSDGTLWASGSNGSGQLGFGDTINKNTLTRVGTENNWNSASGYGLYTTAIKSDGTLWTWGNNSYGHLGLGDLVGRTILTKVGTASNWSSVSGGAYHITAIKSDGTLWSWGKNSAGQLALGDNGNRWSSIQIGGNINHSPIMDSVVANPTTVPTGTISQITCNASDPESDSLIYSWFVNAGIISGTGYQINWTAPDTAGTYTTGVVVSDGYGGFVVSSTDVVVIAHQLPDTGQYQSYTTTFGEDHDYQPAASQPLYTDNSNGTITDNKTGLIWVKDGNSAGCNNGNTLTWEQALTFCEGSTYAGYPDWRLPNVRELESIVDAGTNSPAINTVYFPNTKSSYYWTSTTWRSDATDFKRFIDFTTGSLTGGLNKVSYYYMRCVRGGP